MSTASLRRDHDLIEKVIKSMETTVLMLRGGAIVPESILMQVMDFATNFTDNVIIRKKIHVAKLNAYQFFFQPDRRLLWI